MSLSLYHQCDVCGNHEERVFTDSYTGKALCIMCLDRVLSKTTMSPSEDGDNFRHLIKELEA